MKVTPPPPLVPGAVHRVEITERDDRARGLATLGRRALRVPNALAGETLEVRLSHVGRHLAVGRIVGVLKGSSDRVTDGCPHGEVCPGCGLRTSSPSSRLAFKRARVVEAFADAGLPTDGIGEVAAAPAQDGWRHKAFLTARRTRRGLFLGLFEEHSHRLLGIEGCPAHAVPVEKTLALLRRVLSRLDPPTYDERSGEGWLRSVVVRASSATGETLVTLVATGRTYDGALALASAIRDGAPWISGVVLNLHAERGNAPLGTEFETLVGAGSLEEGEAPLRVRVSAGSFFQVHPAVGARIHDAVRLAAATAAPGEALDLFGGVGATSLRLAADGRAVTLVESPGPGALDATFNAARFQDESPASPPIRVVAARAEQVAPDLLRRGPSVVVVNPPRSGLDRALAGQLKDTPPGLLLYVSCDPTSLARDVRTVMGSGIGGRLALESVTPYDLMPQTPHVEALAVLRRLA